MSLEERLSRIPDNLVILELANNHMGSVDHGLKIIKSFSELINEFPEFTFSFKLQYRDLDTFIRPDYQNRLDVKHVKRFQETRLKRDEQKKLANSIKECGFKSMCTPFDENSVDTIKEDNFDIIKVASCSCGDWSLLEKIATTDLPIIASTGGASLDNIDRLISFFQNREKDFIIQHCVGEYPTALERMNINQIDFLKKRYPDIRFGFSTHEDPDDNDIIKMAVAKGAISFERHVGIPTHEWPLNLYSSNLNQIRQWLISAKTAIKASGSIGERYTPSNEELEALRSLQRGVFAAKLLKKGQVLKATKFFLAFPPDEDQLTGDKLSKYNEIKLKTDIQENEPILLSDVEILDSRASVLEKAELIASLLKKSQVIVPDSFNLELSYHYGLDKFEEYGLAMITLVNREYCKKVLISLPNQIHPEQYHKKKEETFHILFGTVNVKLDGKLQTLQQGDVLTILPKVRHEFVSPGGAVIEEISSSHYTDDSYYTDSTISQNEKRKTYITYRL